MSDEARRAEQLELLQPLRSISPQGARALAMLSKGVELATSRADIADESNVAGSLISYCIREAIDSIFPKLGDPKIKDAAQRLIRNWRKVAARPGIDLGTALQDDVGDLERAVNAATAGFLPRVASFLGVLHPGLPAGLAIPAMTVLRELNAAANGGVHGATTYDDAVDLLDRTVDRLVELVAPLAVTAPAYQELIDAGDFQRVSELLGVNADPRIRVHLFDSVRDPQLAYTLAVAELLPGPELWLAYGYLRHLASDNPVAFTALVNRVVAANRLTPDVAGQLLICATFAGAEVMPEVDRLSQKAGGQVRTELMARWLRQNADLPTEPTWWRILTRLVASLNPSPRAFHAPHGVDELLDLAISRLPDIAAKLRSRFSSAVTSTLARLDADAPHTVQFHFDNGHLRARTMSNLLIGAAVRVIALAQALGEDLDLAALSDRSRDAIIRAAVPASIEIAPPERGAAIAALALDAALARMGGDDWPGDTDLHILRIVLPLAGTKSDARIAAALGEPPSPEVAAADLSTASEVRADWFRSAQWAAHLPEEYRPAAWDAVLQRSADGGLAFGPTPRLDRLAEPSAHESPLGEVDISGTTVTEFVALLNSAVSLREPDDPRFAMKLQETITAHTGTHREAWVSNEAAIMQVRDLWARLAIIQSLKSESNDAPRLRWEQLQSLWAGLVAEASTFEADGNDASKPALSRLAGEILDHLRHRVTERPRQAADVDWWGKDVLLAILPIVVWIGADEHDFGMPALFSLRGETVRLLVALSSPIDNDTDRDAAVGRALDLLAEIAASDTGFARSLGHWSRWFIRRTPAWWARHAVQLIGSDSATEIHEALLTANWESGDFAFPLLDRDTPLLNTFASQPADDAADPALTAVLFDVLPITAIEQTTWSAIFRDSPATERALRYLFPDHSIEEDANATRRLEMLGWIAADPEHARMIWRSVDVIAGSPDIGDAQLFNFTAGLAGSNRGAPLSTYHLGDRLVRSLTGADAVATLESMCAGNLGADRAMTQYDMEAVNTWFRGDGQLLPLELRTRVQQALFEIGFTGGTSTE